MPDEFFGSKQAYCLRSEEIEISRYKIGQFYAETDYLPVVEFDLCESWQDKSVECFNDDQLKDWLNKF